MSIYVDPEQYYCSPEPEETASTTQESDELEELDANPFAILDWQHLYQDLEADETDTDDLPIGGYRYIGSIYSLGELSED